MVFRIVVILLCISCLRCQSNPACLHIVYPNRNLHADVVDMRTVEFGSGCDSCTLLRFLAEESHVDAGDAHLRRGIVLAVNMDYACCAEQREALHALRVRHYEKGAARVASCWQTFSRCRCEM